MEVIGTIHSAEHKRMPTRNAELVANHIGKLGVNKIGIEGHKVIIGLHMLRDPRVRFKRELIGRLKEKGVQVVHLENAPEKLAEAYLTEALIGILHTRRGMGQQITEQARLQLSMDRRSRIESRDHQGFQALDTAIEHLLNLQAKVQAHGKARSPEFLGKLIDALMVRRSKTFVSEAQEQGLPAIVVGAMHASHIEELNPEFNVSHIFDKDAYSPQEAEYRRQLEKKQLIWAQGLPTKLIQEVLK